MALNLTVVFRGAEPRVRDGVRGEAISVTAAASPETSRDSGPDAGYSTSGTYRWWSCTTQVIVGSPGIQPVFVNSYRRMTREKYLIPGLRIPVTVSRSDPTRFRIEWDEVPTIDELIARRDPLFTDPDATRPLLQDACAAAGLAPRPGEIDIPWDDIGTTVPELAHAAQAIAAALSGGAASYQTTLLDTPHAAGGADPDSGRPLATAGDDGTNQAARARSDCPPDR